MLQGENLDQSIALGLGTDELVGGVSSFLKRQARKVVNVAEDIARPVTAAATGNFDDAARALKNAVVVVGATPIALASQVATGNLPDIEAARDTSIRVVDNIASAALSAIRSAIRAAARPVVMGFMHGEDLCFGSDVEGATKGEIKAAATAAALPLTTAAAGAAGSSIPGVGTAAGVAAAAALTPQIVSEIVEELWAKGKREIASAVASGVPDEPAAAANLAQEQRNTTRNLLLLTGCGLLLAYQLTKEKRKGGRK